MITNTKSKTTIRCPNFFIVGECKYGNNCTLSHIYPPHFRTEICRHFVRYGKCLQGELCNFIHPEIDYKKNPQEKKCGKNKKNNNNLYFISIININKNFDKNIIEKTDICFTKENNVDKINEINSNRKNSISNTSNTSTTSSSAISSVSSNSYFNENNSYKFLNKRNIDNDDDIDNDDIDNNDCNRKLYKILRNFIKVMKPKK